MVDQEVAIGVTRARAEDVRDHVRGARMYDGEAHYAVLARHLGRHVAPFRRDQQKET